MFIDRDTVYRIDQMINKYIEIEIKKGFLNEFSKSEINLQELSFMAECGVILSESSSHKHRSRALDIATIIASQDINKILNMMASIILGRLKNYRTQDLLQFDEESMIKEGLSPTELLKDILYKKNNTIYIGGKEYTLNDFQFKTYEMINDNKITSISAPTSAGKSFVLKRIVLDLLQRGFKCCVYLVPTRALITEVMNEFKEEVEKLNLGNDISLSSSSDISRVPLKSKNILVLTQERFYQLCNNKQVNVDLLIVDEAQNVMDGSRGILLEYSIKYAKRLWRNLKIVFISPIINNPQKFNEKFKEGEDSGSLYIRESTVRQNIIKLQESSIGYDVIFNNSIIKEKLRISRSKSMYKNIVNVASKFNNGGSSIIYCNKTDLAINVCNALFESNEYEDLDNKDLNDFADFLEHVISKNYTLAKYIRKGIVYHYGNLPSFVRSGIEELASKGLFRFIVCTSTLLQGVNIPVQNIYVYNPSKNDIPLENLEFWNLLGRAGRMGYDWCGNIILIQNKKWNNIDRYDSKNSSVEFESDKYKKTKLINEIFKRNENNNCDNIENKDINNYIISTSIIDRINNEAIVVDQEHIENHNIETYIDGIISNFEPPKELLIKLVGIRYDSIKKLWAFFESNQVNIDEFILKHPYSCDKNKFLISYRKIIHIINDYLMDYELFDELTEDKLIFMSYSWITESKLKDILLYKIKHQDFTDMEEKKINKIISTKIKKEVKFLNQNIRYKLVKGFYAYEEILRSFLQEKNRQDLADKILNIPLFIEFGACKKNTIHLISYGLNREFAIEIINQFKIRESHFDEDLKSINIKKINNTYTQKKIHEFIKTYT